MDVNKIREQHAAWSKERFGNASFYGPLRHMKEELDELIADPFDLSEWADVQLLFWDALRRANISDATLHRACAYKLEILKSREYGPVVEGQPVHHIKQLSDKLKPGDVIKSSSTSLFYMFLNHDDGRYARFISLASGNYSLIPRKNVNKMTLVGRKFKRRG